MAVLPTFWTVMRKTTLLWMETGWFVGLSKTLTTFTAAELTFSVALEELVAVAPLAVAAVGAVPMASVVNETVIFVLWPGANAPKLFHVSVPPATVSGAKLAEE